MPESGHVDHAVLLTHAQDKVNVPSEEAAKRRKQVNHLRTRLETFIGERSSARFSHTYCEECARIHYPDFVD